MNETHVHRYYGYELALLNGSPTLLHCASGRRQRATIHLAYQLGFPITDSSVQKLFVAGGMATNDVTNEVNYLSLETNAGGANWAASHR